MLGVKHMGHPVTHNGKPYIKTIDGKVVTAQTVKQKRTNLLVDNDKVPLETVQEYCNGKDSFMRIGNGFAAKVQSGDINIYSKNSTYSSTEMSGGGMKTSSHTVTDYYLLPPQSPALLLLNYKNVKPLIRSDEPAYKYMLQYDKNKKANRILLYSSLGAIAGGITMMAVSGLEGSVATVGGIALATGAAGGFTCFIRNGTNQRHLARAVARHNGVLSD